jgi:hypothetical protein
MTLRSQFLELPVSHLLQAADEKARETGNFNNRSMRGLGGRQVGFLGELVVMEHFDHIGLPYEPKFTLKHDIDIIMPEGSKLLEVKTKERTVVPKEDYECSVPKYVKDYQAVDFYIFVSLLSTGKSEDINRFTKAFILGTITKERFEEQATLWTTNKTDSTNNWTPTIDVWNVPISALKPPYIPSRV